MPTAETQSFVRLQDGTILVRQTDGSYVPTRSETAWARLDALSADEIEHMAANDPDHPALDDAFWNGVDERRRGGQAIKLDDDVLSFFRRSGAGFEARINAVLRDYVEVRQRERR